MEEVAYLETCQLLTVSHRQPILPVSILLEWLPGDRPGTLLRDPCNIHLPYCPVDYTYHVIDAYPHMDYFVSVAIHSAFLGLQT